MEEIKMVLTKIMIKEIAKGFKISSDFYLALDQEVTNIIKSSIRRAESNGRRTIMSKDL